MKKVLSNCLCALLGAVLASGSVFAQSDQADLVHFGDLLEVDHIIPTALGGKDNRGNKWVYHRHCHDEKTAEDMARIATDKAAGINHK